MDCVADTHASIWYLFAASELSTDAKVYMDDVSASGGTIFIPTISIVEVIYLIEKGKLSTLNPKPVNPSCRPSERWFFI